MVYQENMLALSLRTPSLSWMKEMLKMQGIRKYIQVTDIQITIPACLTRYLLSIDVSINKPLRIEEVQRILIS